MKTKTVNSMKFYRNLAIVLPLSMAFLACSSDDDNPAPINEGEEINQVILTFTNQTTAETSEFTWVDGDNGVPVTLDSGSTYDVSVQFLDASNPADIEDVTLEVIGEADEHQVFYEIQGNLVNITSANDDETDSNGNNLGIRTVWQTFTAGESTVRVFLVHEPVAKTGDTRNDLGGETDAQVDFNITLE